MGVNVQAEKLDTSRSRVALGDKGVDALARATVMVVGLGGVGSACAVALVRAGVGRLIVVDRDVVEPSNCNRQAVAFQRTIGMAKTEVMKRLALEINPAIEVVCHQLFVTPENVGALLDEQPDYVIDAIDNITAKLSLAEQTISRGIPIVSAMGGGNKFDPTRLEFCELRKTSVDPVAKIMRKQARARGIERLRVLYSREEPKPVPLPEGADKNARPVVGTVSYMPPIMGMMLAGDVICAIAGVREQHVPATPPAAAEDA